MYSKSSLKQQILLGDLRPGPCKACGEFYTEVDLCNACNFATQELSTVSQMLDLTVDEEVSLFDAARQYCIEIMGLSHIQSGAELADRTKGKKIQPKHLSRKYL